MSRWIKADGYTLLEVILASGIMVVVVAAISSFYSTGLRLFCTGLDELELQRNSDRAVNMCIRSDLRDLYEVYNAGSSFIHCRSSEGTIIIYVFHPDTNEIHRFTAQVAGSEQSDITAFDLPQEARTVIEDTYGGSLDWQGAYSVTPEIVADSATILQFSYYDMAFDGDDPGASLLTGSVVPQSKTSQISFVRVDLALIEGESQTMTESWVQLRNLSL